MDAGYLDFSGGMYWGAVVAMSRTLSGATLNYEGEVPKKKKDIFFLAALLEAFLRCMYFR